MLRRALEWIGRLIGSLMRLVTRLDRSVFRQVLGPSILACLVYTLLLVMNGLFTLMEQVVVYGVALKDAGHLMAIGLPNILIITIPVSFLFGTLLAAGRMTTDNEIVALQAGGISLLKLYRPILGMGLVFTALTGYLSEAVVPDATRTMKELRTSRWNFNAMVLPLPVSLRTSHPAAICSGWSTWPNRWPGSPSRRTRNSPVCS